MQVSFKKRVKHCSVAVQNSKRFKASNKSVHKMNGNNKSNDPLKVAVNNVQDKDVIPIENKYWPLLTVGRDELNVTAENSDLDGSHESGK